MLAAATDPGGCRIDYAFTAELSVVAALTRAIPDSESWVTTRFLPCSSTQLSTQSQRSSRSYRRCSDTAGKAAIAARDITTIGPVPQQ